MKNKSMGILSLIVASILLAGNFSSVNALTSMSSNTVANGGSEINTTTSTTTSTITSTPIKHLVVLFQENIAFDHYFGTYPYAANPAGEPPFKADPHTPSVNGLLNEGLLTGFINSINPFRLDSF